ncbi:hypothetical protein E8E11_005916 [Didymella keratinophila]|nr:hypothetical protein E8E11_005916 [Didymella keratinophila]
MGPLPPTSRGNPCQLQGLEEQFTKECPLSHAAFLQADTFKKRKIKVNRLYLINTNPNVNGKLALTCNTNGPNRTRNLNHYVSKIVFLPNNFWARACNARKVDAFSQRVATIFQYAELLSGHRKYYVGAPGLRHGAPRSYAGFKREYARDLGVQENGTRYHEVKDDDRIQRADDSSSETEELDGGLGNTAKKRTHDSNDDGAFMTKRLCLD